MKKLLKNPISLITVCVAAFLVAIMFYSGVSSISKLCGMRAEKTGNNTEFVLENAEYGLEEPNMNADDLVFSSYSAYETYLAEQMANDNDTPEISPLHRSLITALPADASLQSIIVNEGGTVYTYTLSRQPVLRSGGWNGGSIYTYINTIQLDPADTILAARFQTLIIRNVATDYVQNTRTFSANLAADIGADYIGSLSTLSTDVYEGKIFGYTSDYSQPYIQLGRQQIIWEQTSGQNGLSNEDVTGTVTYMYNPASMTELEIERLISAVANAANAEYNILEVNNDE